MHKANCIKLHGAEAMRVVGMLDLPARTCHAVELVPLCSA